MNIKIVKGTGEGPTEIAAFDRALFKAGIHDFNLIKLSSVVPENSTIRTIKRFTPAKNSIGNKLYIVLSIQSETIPNQMACAGLGWAINKKSGSGIFVELNGNNLNKLEDELSKSMHKMTEYRKGPYKFNKLIVKARCEKRPICVLVAAIYKQSKWN